MAAVSVVKITNGRVDFRFKCCPCMFQKYDAFMSWRGRSTNDGAYYVGSF